MHAAPLREDAPSESRRKGLRTTARTLSSRELLTRAQRLALLTQAEQVVPQPCNDVPQRDAGGCDSGCRRHTGCGNTRGPTSRSRRARDQRLSHFRCARGRLWQRLRVARTYPAPDFY